MSERTKPIIIDISLSELTSGASPTVSTRVLANDSREVARIGDRNATVLITANSDVDLNSSTDPNTGSNSEVRLSVVDVIEATAGVSRVVIDAGIVKIVIHKKEEAVPS